MKSMLQLGCILLLALALSSCKTIQGGGWIGSASGEGKASFGINLTCENSEYYGEFTYHDNGVKVEMPDGKMRKLAIQAWVGPGEPLSSCSYLKEGSPWTSWYFYYRAQPDKFRETGTGIIEFFDADLTEDPNDEDVLSIEIMTGPFEGYSNDGELGGGNLIL